MLILRTTGIREQARGGPHTSLPATRDGDRRAAWLSPTCGATFVIECSGCAKAYLLPGRIPSFFTRPGHGKTRHSHRFRGTAAGLGTGNATLRQRPIARKGAPGQLCQGCRVFLAHNTVCACYVLNALHERRPAARVYNNPTAKPLFMRGTSMDEHGERTTGGSLCHCERLSPFGKCRSNSIKQTLQVEA